MKKMIALMATIMITMTACADRQELVEYSELPALAQSFIQKHFNAADVSFIEREKEGGRYEYNVYLKNSVKIEFNYQGNLQSIDCNRSPVPDDIIPSIILDYVALHHPNAYIVEYSIGYRRLKVGLNNDWELVFDLDGNFIGVDD